MDGGFVRFFSLLRKYLFFSELYFFPESLWLELYGTFLGIVDLMNVSIACELRPMNDDVEMFSRLGGSLPFAYQETSVVHLNLLLTIICVSLSDSFHCSFYKPEMIFIRIP